MSNTDTAIEISASAERVWQILLDFPAYAQWNPSMPRIDGDAKPDGRLTVELVPPGGRNMKITPRITDLQPQQRLVWRGGFIAPWIFQGTHHFVLEPIASDGVRFHHYENFGGIFRWPLLLFVRSSTRNGFIAMNEALKQRAEGSSA